MSWQCFDCVATAIRVMECRRNNRTHTYTRTHTTHTVLCCVQQKSWTFTTRSTGTVHSSAKARLTSVAIRVPGPDSWSGWIPTKSEPFVHWPIASLPWKFHANPFGSFCAKLITDRQTNRQTNNDDHISSLVEVITTQTRKELNKNFTCTKWHFKQHGLVSYNSYNSTSNLLKR